MKGDVTTAAREVIDAAGGVWPAASLVRYAEIAWAWNLRTSLVASTDPHSFCEILFADAIQLLNNDFFPQGSRIVDVGAGVGAPLIPVLLVREDVHAALVEPRRKRVAFLRHAIGSLGLERQVQVIEQHVDIDDPVLSGTPFQVAISRATFDPFTWLRMGAALADQVVVCLGDATPPAHPNMHITKDVRYQLTGGSPRRLVLYVRD